MMQLNISRMITTVQQDVLLFNQSVWFNLTVGLDEEPSEEAVIDVLRSLDMWRFVQKLPMKLHNNIGPGGRNLSGGMRQRISVARGILCDRPILLLDEPTSAQDMVVRGPTMIYCLESGCIGGERCLPSNTYSRHPSPVALASMSSSRNAIPRKDRPNWSSVVGCYGSMLSMVWVFLHLPWNKERASQDPLIAPGESLFPLDWKLLSDLHATFYNFVQLSP